MIWVNFILHLEDLVSGHLLIGTIQNTFKLQSTEWTKIKRKGRMGIILELVDTLQKLGEIAELAALE